MSKNYLEMSDDDFLNLPEHSGEVAADTPVEEEAPVVQDTAETVVEEEKPVEDQTQTPDPTDPPVEDEPEKPAVTEPAPASGKKDEKVTEPPKDGEVQPEKSANPDDVVAETPNYEELYKKIIAPLKANGKTIEIKDADEAIRLMQMGAGFGRKMQEIQPHLKTLRLLDQNNLLNVDQSELAFLIDLKNKNPDAIRKLVKDAGIDPLDMANDEPVNYRSNVQPVTDTEVVFSQALSDLKDREGGVDTINVCRTTWDPQSQTVLMENPGLLDVIHDHRQNGTYDQIVKEMDRQIALNRIPAGTPFIHAYKQVGEYLQNTNGFVTTQSPTPSPAPTPVVQPQPTDTRIATPKPSVSNSAQASAAATPRTTPRKAAPLVNPLAMSDEEYMKQYGNRYLG